MPNPTAIQSRNAAGPMKQVAIAQLANRSAIGLARISKFEAKFIVSLTVRVVKRLRSANERTVPVDNLRVG